MVDRLSHIHSQYSKCKIGLCELREQERTKGRRKRCEKMEERWRKDALHARMEGVDWRCTAKSRCIARSRSSRCFFFLSRATVGTIDRSEGHKIDRARFVDPAIRLSLLFCPDFPLGWPIGKLNIGAQTAAAIRTSLRDDWFDDRISVSRLSFPFPFRFKERRDTLVDNSVLCVTHSWNFVFVEFCRVCFVHWIAMHGVSFLVSGICNADFYFYSSC